MQVVAILGSVTPPGRLAAAVKSALDRLAPSGVGTELLDLGQLRLGFADGRPPEQLGDDTAGLVATISAADAVLLATPVYRATLTGALKNALDLLPVDALAAKPVGIAAMGATLHHSLGAESHLRDILSWFGAIVAPVNVYFTAADFASGALSDRAAADLDALLRALVALGGATSGVALGPAPLAARRP